MVFNKQLGKMFSRKKPVDTPKEKLADGSNSAEESVLQPSLTSEGLDVGVTKVGTPDAVERVVLESYSLNAPYASVDVTRDSLRGNVTYILKEPALTETDVTNLNRLKDILNQVLLVKSSDLQSKQAASDYLVKKCNEVLDNYKFNLDPVTRGKLLYYVLRDNTGFGKIDALMHDPLIEDISCDGVNVNMYVWHRKFESIPTNVKFETASELVHVRP